MRTYRRKARVAPSDELHKMQDDLDPTKYNWIVFKLFVAWLNCLITPILIGVVQDVPMWNEMAVIGFCCDLVVCLQILSDIFSWLQQSRLKNQTFPHPSRIPSTLEMIPFITDLISVFPLCAVPISIALGSEGLTLALLCAPRMIQITTVFRNFHLWKDLLPRDSPLRNGTLSRVVLVFVLTCLHASTLACCWFLISCPHLNGGCPNSNAWVDEDKVLHTDNAFSRYIRSLHFVMQTLFTVGYGDIAPQNDQEIMFSLFLVLNGSLFYGFLISSITSLISNKDISMKLFRGDMAALRLFMEMRDLPSELTSRIDGLFKFLFNRQCGLLESRFLQDIPGTLVREIKRSYIPQLILVPFFSQQSTRLIRQVADRMVLRSYVPKATVLFQNERRRELFLIRFGRLDIKVRSSPNALFSYMSGEYVGDFQLIFGTQSEFTVESGAFTEVLVLTFDALVEGISASGEVPRGEDFEKWLSNQQSSLEATVDTHKKLLLRVIKVRTSMEEVKKKNKLAEMMADVTLEKHPWVILPDSVFKPIWSVIIICGIWYYMLMIPLRILANIHCDSTSTQDCLTAWDWSLVIDYFVDLIFIADTCLRAWCFAFTRFEGEQHVVVTDMQEIHAQFMSSRTQLTLVVMGLVPIDIFSLVSGYLLCLRLVKLIWTLQLFGNIAEFLSYFEYRNKKSLISTEGVTVIHLSIIALTVCLWTSVCWSVIHIDSSSTGFVESVYWCLTTMTTVGYGDIVSTTNTNTVFVVAACIICPCTCATIIATAASYIHNTDISVDNIDHRKLVVETFLSSTICGNELSDDITVVGGEAMAYIDHVGREKHGLDEKKMMKTMLPDYMQEDIRQFLVMDIVLSQKMFSFCESGFIRQIMLVMDRQVVIAGATILSTGVAAEGMYMIQNGLVQILTAQGRKTQKLSHGDCFAELYLFEETTFCNFKAQAHTNCEIWYLRRHKFKEVVREGGHRAMRPTVDEMHEVAKALAKKMIETPAPTVRALQVIHELGTVDNDRIFVKPQTREYNAWLLLVSLITVYNFLSIPARLALMEGTNNVVLSTAVVDFFGDVIYIADIFLRMFFLAYMDRQELIMSKAKIRVHYMESGFYRHLIASIPFDILVFSGSISGLSIAQSHMLFRLNKLLRVVDLSSFISSAESFFFCRSGSLLRNTIRVAKLMFVVFLAAHLVGCLFFAVANQEHINGNPNNWADISGILRECSFGSYKSDKSYCDSPPSVTLMLSQYMHSIYWATATLTTVGYGDIAAVSTIEQIISLFVFIAGSFVYTMVITNLQDIVSHLDVTSDLFKSRRDRVEKLLVRENVPPELLRKADAYLDKLWQAQCGARGGEIKEFLAPNIYSDIVLQLLKSKLDSIFFIKQCSRGFQLDLIQKMELNYYMATDFVYHCGEAAMSLYVIVKGDVALVSEDTGQQYSKVFAAKGVLGESEFFTRGCYACAAEVTNDVTCYEITYHDMWDLVEQYRLYDTYAALMRTSYVNLYKNSSTNMVQTLKGNFKSNKMTKMMSVKQMSVRIDNTILPTSWKARLWVILTTIFMVYQIITVPYCAAFRDDILTIALIDAVISVFFTVDIYLNLRYFAIEENGVLITSRQALSSRYVDSYILKDILSSIPVALLVYAVTGDTTAFSFMRLIHLVRFWKINDCINKILGMVENFSHWRISSDSVRVLKTILVVWYFGHITACLLCLIGKQSNFSWIYENDFESLPSMSIYLRGYLWAMYTIITVGYGSITLSTNLERAFSACVMIMGAILCDAGMTAVLSSIIGNADKQSGLTRRSREATLQFCQSNQMSDSIVLKVNVYYDYLTTTLNNSVESQDFELLPKAIMLEFVQFSTFDSICSLCLLDISSSEHRLGFVYSILRHAVPTVALPGQEILTEDDDSDVHILRKGRAFARYFKAHDPNCQKDYFQEGEALCRDGRLSTSVMSPGKHIKVVLGSASGLIGNKSGPFQTSSVYAGLGVGARKVRSSIKPSSRGCVKWGETFGFHAPQAAPSLQILLFEDEETKDGGLIGRCNIQFDELESMEVLAKEEIEEQSSPRRRSPGPEASVSIPESRCVLTFTNGSGGRLNSLPNFTDTNTTCGEGIDTENGGSQSFSYHIKQDIRDKNGRLKGIVDMEITMRNVGTNDEARKNTYLKCRQKSTKPVEVVAETVCHMFTIEAARLTELKEYYWNHLDPSRKVTVGNGISRKRRKSSFVHANMMDIMKRRQNSSETDISEVEGDREEKYNDVVNDVRGSCRRGGMQNAHRTSEFLRSGELLISIPLLPTREGVGQSDKRTESSGSEGSIGLSDNDDEGGVEDAEEDNNGGDAHIDISGNLTTGDISEGELQEAFGLKTCVDDLKDRKGPRSEFELSWRRS